MTNYCFNEGLNRIKVLNPNFEYKKWINNIAIHPESIPEYHFYEKQNPIIKTSYKINSKQITGTSHPDYCNKSWVEVLGNLKRWKLYVDEIHLATENVLNEKLVDKKSVAKYGDNIIVSMGNHRCCFSKFLELDEITVDMEEYQFNHTLYSMVKEYENRGFFIDENQYKNETWNISINNYLVSIPEHLKNGFLEFYDSVMMNIKSIISIEFNHLMNLNNRSKIHFKLECSDSFRKIQNQVVAHKFDLSKNYKTLRT